MRTGALNQPAVALIVLLAATTAACGGGGARHGIGGGRGGSGGAAASGGGAGGGGPAGTGGVAGTGAVVGTGGGGGTGGVAGTGGGPAGTGGVAGTGAVVGAGGTGAIGGTGSGGAGGSGGAAVDAGPDSSISTGGSRADAAGDTATPQEWTRQFGTVVNDEARAVTVDGSGNVYVAGQTRGMFDGLSAGGGDAFLRKYDGGGTELWTRQFGSTGNDYVFSVSVGGDGNVYVAGWTDGALPGQTQAGVRDAHVRKYDGNGNDLWARQFGTAADDFGQSVAVDGSGDVYVAGYTSGILPGQSSAAGVDTFLRKYDGSGTELWTRQFGSAQDDYGQSVCVDGSGNVYLAGYTSGALPGRTSAGAQDAFVRKYDSGGAELWTRQFGSGARDIGRSVAVDGSGGVYIGGYTEGALDPNRNPIDMMTEVFVKKYDSGGAEKWIRQFGWNGTHFGQSVSVDGSGVYVVGYSDNLSPNAGVFAKKYEASGTDQWTRTFGTTSGNEAYSASVDGSGHIYIAGYTSGTLPGQSSAGLHDAFVQMLKP